MRNAARFLFACLSSLLLTTPAMLWSTTAEAQVPPGFDQPRRRPGQMPQPGRQPQKPGSDTPAKPREPQKPSPVMSDEMEEARTRAQEKGVLRGTMPVMGRIFEIHVEGATKVEPDAVLVHVQSRVDKAPDARIIASDIKRIFAMGLFADVTAKTIEGPVGSAILTFSLTEKPAIGQVRFEGNTDVNDDDISEVIDLKAFQVLDVPRVRKNVEKIQKLYVDKGFYLAEVDYELVLTDGKNAGKEVQSDPFFLDTERFFADEAEAISSDAPPVGEDENFGRFVDVVFKIDEHAKVKVNNINITGNHHIAEDDIKAVLRTREDHPLGLLTEWGVYKEELAEIDLLAIEALYQDKGFINVQVGQPQVALSQDKTRMSITIPVEEGDQFTLSGFDLGGELVVEDPEEFARIQAEDPEKVVFLKSRLLAETRVKSGEIFARSKVAQDILTITDRYRDKGHAYVQIIPETAVDPEAKTLGLTLRVQAGPRVRVERINITGNTKTQDRVIRRELRIYEGEYYSATDLRRSEQRVTALGFFETVEVTSKQGSRPDLMVVVVNIKEKATGQFQLGAGFSGAEQFIFQGQISQNNFLGRGHTVSGSVQWSRLRQMLDFRFIDPYAFYIAQEPMTFALSVFNNQTFFNNFNRNSLGADITLGYPVGRPFNFITEPLFELAPKALLPYVPDLDNFQFYLTFNGERVEIAEQSFNVKVFGLDSDIPRYTSSLRASLLFDQRNNRLFPSQGYYLQLAAEFATPFLGSGLMPGAETLAADATSSFNNVFNNNLDFLKPGGRATDFQRYSMTARAYYNFDQFLPVSGVVAKINMELGYLATQDQSLVFEHYFLGGFNTIRGYFPRTISPVKRVGGLYVDEGLQEFAIGGNKQFYTNIELEFPVFEQVGIRGVVFFDAGNVYAHDENFFYLGDSPSAYLANTTCAGQACFDPVKDLPLGLYYSAGIGVRWFSPIGPLRFEWGVPLTPRPQGTFGLPAGDQPVQFEFNIGNSF